MSENFGVTLTPPEMRWLEAIVNEGASMKLTPARSFWLANMAGPMERWAFDLGRRETQWIMENAEC